MTGGMTITPTNKRTIRQKPNPLDKATVISIYPRQISEIKHTVQPGVFNIDAGSEATPALMTIGPSSWWRDIGEEMPLIEIPNSAIVVAEAFVNDYCNGLLMCDMNESMPGLFFIPGEISVAELKDKYPTELKNAIRKQRNWFTNLVRLGDAGWSQTNGNPRAINELMRLAAEALGLTDRDWMKGSTEVEKVKCVACGNLRNPAFPVCGNCNRIVDLPLAKKLGIVDAKA